MKPGWAEYKVGKWPAYHDPATSITLYHFSSGWYFRVGILPVQKGPYTSFEEAEAMAMLFKAAQ